MDIHVVAEDPVRDAVVTALADVDLESRDADPDDVADARFAVVGGVVGSDAFARANEAARAGSTPWLAVEIGGIGGHPLADVEAAVSGFAPGTGCYECLRSRVASTVEETADRPRADRATARFAGAVAGRECVRVLSGDDRSIIGFAREFPHARRRLLPVPTCACASGERDRLPGDDDESLDLEDAVDRVEVAIDSRIGLVTAIAEAESFPAPYYLATTADTAGYSDASAPSQAAGVDPDWNAALMKATGEALERYCAAVYREDEFVRATVADVPSPVSPEALVRPEDAPAIDDETEYYWAEGRDLETGDAVHLPAAAVHFPQPGERLVPAITTGLGLGSSTAGALRSGLTEVVERDATMLSWYSAAEPPGLAVDDEAFEALARRARSEELSVTPLLVTQDVDVPVVAVAVHREDGPWPRFAVGSACHLDPAAAARSALAEALQNWMELRGLGQEDADEAGGAIGEYASFPEAARAFVDVDRTVSADAAAPDPVPDGRDALETLVSRVVDAGLTPYASRLTTRDAEQLGFEAVRVVVPGAQPLFTGESFFGERARTVPEARGEKARLEREFHPYP